MTDLLSLFKEKADAFLEAINQKGGVRATIEGLRRQMAEADRRRAIGRVKAELRRLDRQINEMVTAVGVQAVALQEAGQLSSPELQPLCQHIIDLKRALSQQQAELAALEAVAGSPAPTEAKPCARCGKPVPLGGTFCSYCGAPVSPPGEAPSSGMVPAAGAAQPPPAAAPSPSTATVGPQPPPTRPPSRTEQAPSTATAAPPPTCVHCGALLKPRAKFCSRCGRAV